jgi:hypothetical protein
MSHNIIFEHIGKDKSTVVLYKDKSNKSCIDLYTKKSSFLCPECNSTRSGKCKCKDKDYIQGCWHGFLLSDENYDIMYNIYDFIKNNIDEFSEYDRIQLELSFISENDNFLKNYYGNLYQELESFCEINKRIFTEEFYELFKQNYLNLIDRENEDNFYMIDFISNKNNFIRDFSISNIDKLSIFNEYKSYNLENLLKNDLENLLHLCTFKTPILRQIIF